MNSPTPIVTSCLRRLSLCALAPIISVALLAACSQSDGTPVTQAVAKVNKGEITELQVNQVLERQRDLKPEQVDAASGRAVTALVDQEIVYQKAHELKLDRDPHVVQAIEAAKREIISRAYLERVADGAAPPSVDEVRAYFDGRPALFKQRRIYSLQELAVETPPERRAELETDLKSLKSSAELESYLKDKHLRVHVDRTTVAAENLPLGLLDRLAAVKPGSGLVLPAPDGVRVVFVSATQDAPATMEQAQPAIQTFLLNDRRRQTIEKEMQSLRAGASVEYLGKYKGLAASAARPGGGASAASASSFPPSTAAPTMDQATLSKGMSGLK